MGDGSLRLAVHGAFALPDLAADPAIADVHPDGTVDLWASYWDTTDLRLARHGVTLRHRSLGATDTVWSLQLPVPDEPHQAGAESASTTGEIEFPGSGERIPAGAADLVMAYARTAPLTEIAALTTRRRRWSLLDEDGSVTATLTDDEVSVVDDGTPVSRFREIELEPHRLSAEVLARLGDLLREGGAVDAEPIPLVIRALGPAATAPADAVAPSIDADASAGAVLRAALTSAVDRFVRNDAGVRLGDAEALHQARVGLRTLRSHLRVFGPLLERRWTASVEAELRPLADALGRVRDLDVLATRVRDHGGDLAPLLGPFVDDIAERRATAQAELLAMMRDERYASLLERLVAAASAPRVLARAGGPARTELPPLFRAAWKRVRSRADALGPRSGAAAYHAVRIRVKRARYAAGAIAVGLDTDDRVDAERFARRAAKLQATLGASQDAAMARTEIMAAAAHHLTDGPFNLAAGVLLEREGRSGEEAQRAFREAWPRARRRRRRAWARP
jgi:CHAD domain-containing protein